MDSHQPGGKEPPFTVAICQDGLRLPLAVLGASTRKEAESLVGQFLYAVSFPASQAVERSTTARRSADQAPRSRVWEIADRYAGNGPMDIGRFHLRVSYRPAKQLLRIFHAGSADEAKKLMGEKFHPPEERPQSDNTEPLNPCRNPFGEIRGWCNYPCGRPTSCERVKRWHSP